MIAAPGLAPGQYATPRAISGAVPPRPAPSAAPFRPAPRRRRRVQRRLHLRDGADGTIGDGTIGDGFAAPTRRMDGLAVRFYFRGKLEHDGKDWQYIGGRSGCSSVPISNLTVHGLKGHLADHIRISHEDLQETRLSWRLIDKDRNLNFICSLDDDTNVNSMARHVRRVADDFVEIFAVMPDKDSSDEEYAVDEEEAMTVEQQVQYEQHVATEQQLELMQIKMEHEHQVEYDQQEGRQIAHLDQQLLQAFVPNIARKMPVVRGGRPYGPSALNNY